MTALSLTLLIILLRLLLIHHLCYSTVIAEVIFYDYMLTLLRLLMPHFMRDLCYVKEKKYAMMCEYISGRYVIPNIYSH